MTAVASFKKLCLDQEVPVLEINNRRRCFREVLYECYAVFFVPVHFLVYDAIKYLVLYLNQV